jgi:hypothetical protein
MGNLKNAALFWCKIKGYIMLVLIAIFSILLVANLLGATSSAKSSEEKATAKKGAVISAIFVGMFTLFYFLLKTDIGCGLSIVSNAYQLVR